MKTIKEMTTRELKEALVEFSLYAEAKEYRGELVEELLSRLREISKEVEELQKLINK